MQMELMCKWCPEALTKVTSDQTSKYLRPDLHMVLSEYPVLLWIMARWATPVAYQTGQ